MVTNRLAAYVRSAVFADDLRLLVQSSPTLRRRWEKIGCALDHHQRRDYVSAISVAMPEVEGVFRDMQVLRGQVRRHKGRWVVAKSGVLVPNRKGDPMTINGFDMLLTHADFGDNEVMQTVGHLVGSEFIAQRRNSTLHGESFPIERAKVSAQILLLLYVMSRELQTVEHDVFGTDA